MLAIATGTPLAIIAAMIVRRSSNRSSLEELDAIDKKVLRIVRNLGGETIMSMIMDRAGIPRTTLWRRVKKLSKLGYVEIKKIGRSSVIRLRKV